MTRERFSAEEAQGKVGRMVRSLVEFSGVPKGTTGRVVAVYEVGRDRFSVDVEWNLPERAKPLRDGFSKDEYERFLVEE